MEHFPVCNTSMNVIGRTYPIRDRRSYEEFITDMSEWINGDCHGIVVNGSDILFNAYNPNRTFREKIIDNGIKRDCGANVHEVLLCEINRLERETIIDIYLFPNCSQRIHIVYHPERKTYTTSFFDFYVSYHSDDD